MIRVLNDLTKGCEYGMGHYRHLEKDKTKALAKSRGNFEGKLELSQEAKSDLAWWIQNLSRGPRDCINHRCLGVWLGSGGVSSPQWGEVHH